LNAYTAYQEIKALLRGEEIGIPGTSRPGIGQGTVIINYQDLPEGFSGKGNYVAPNGEGFYEKRNGNVYKDGKLVWTPAAGGAAFWL
jgi:hypothetical protein